MPHVLVLLCLIYLTKYQTFVPLFSILVFFPPVSFDFPSSIRILLLYVRQMQINAFSIHICLNEKEISVFADNYCVSKKLYITANIFSDVFFIV